MMEENNVLHSTQPPSLTFGEKFSQRNTKKGTFFIYPSSFAIRTHQPQIQQCQIPSNPITNPLYSLYISQLFQLAIPSSLRSIPTLNCKFRHENLSNNAI